MSRSGHPEAQAMLFYEAFEEVELTDWFDWPVLAIGRLVGTPGLGLLGLLAWAPDRRERVVAFVPLDPASSAAALASGQHDWSTRLPALRAIVSSARGPAALFLTRDEEIVSRRDIDVESVAPVVVSDVEEAIADDRVHWFTAAAAP